MKQLLLLILLLSSLCSHAQSFPGCFTTFKKQGYRATVTKTGDTIQLQQLSGLTGNNQVVAEEAYHIAYRHKKQGKLAEITVQHITPAGYAADTTVLLEAFHRLANTHAASTQLLYNGYTLYGWKNNNAQAGIQEVFVFFPGSNAIVYLFFTGTKEQSPEAYASERNNFLGEYTSHLRYCTR